MQNNAKKAYVNMKKEREVNALCAGNNFYMFFRRHIVPKMNDVEKIRIKFLIIYCLLGTAGVAVLLQISPTTSEIKTIFYLLCSIIIFFFCKVIKNNYKATVKEKVVNRLLTYLGNDFFMANKIVLIRDTQAFQSIEMIRDFDGEPEIDDLITGTYKNIPIEIMEAELKGTLKLPQKGNNFSLKALIGFLAKAVICITKVAILAVLLRGRSFQFRGVGSMFTETMFKGLLFTFPLKNNITTVITRNRDFLQPINIGEDINLEDLEFNRIYQTSGFNQIEARILLKPAFMERLKELSYKGLKVACCFQIQKASIAIETKKDMFELPFFRSTKNIKCYREIISQIEDVLSIIDTLKLTK